MELSQKYKSLEKVFNGPSSNSLLKWEKQLSDPEYKNGVDDYLLNEAIIYFCAQYIEKVNELIMADCLYYLNEDEIFDNEMIESVINMIKNNKDSINKIIKINYNDYQEAALKFLDDNRGKNSLIIMPTGYGKTIIAFWEAMKQLNLGKKIVFTAPTNELVKQQYKSFIEFLESIVLNKSYIKKTDLEYDKTKEIFFLTNHKMANYIKKGELDDTFFYIIDEVHEGEGKQGQQKEHKYPSFIAFENGNYNILTLSATPTNLPLLKDKLGIKKIFNGSNRKFFVAKNREFLFSDKDQPFLETEKIINQEIYNELEYVGNFIEKNLGNKLLTNKELEILKKYSKENLFNKTYIDSTEIIQLEEIFDKKENKEFFNCLWKYKKVLEIRKKLYEDDYSSLREYLENKVNKHNEVIKDFSNLLQKVRFIESEIKKLTNYYNNLGISIKKNHKDEILGKINDTESEKKKLRKKIYKIGSNIHKNKWYTNMLNTLLRKLHHYKDTRVLHPKTKDLFNIIDKKKKGGKTIFIHIENEGLIKNLLAYAINKGYKASYFKGGTKNKKNKFVDKYTVEKIKDHSLDFVFVTSVFKLGMNFDIDNLIFYHSPKNKKDLLQFEGRVGRYSNTANIVYMGVKEGFEKSKVLKTINNANSFLEKQFDYADRWLSEYNEVTDNSTKNLYQKNKKHKKENGEYNVSDLLDKNIYKPNFINSRFKLNNILGIYKDKNSRLYISLYFVDNSSNRGINVQIKYNGRLKKENNIIQKLNDLANSLSIGKIYSVSGQIKPIFGGEDIIISLKYNNPSEKINLMEEKTYDENDYIVKNKFINTDEIEHIISNTYDKGRNYMTSNLFK